MINLGDECPTLAPLVPFLNSAEDWGHQHVYGHALTVTINTAVAIVLLVASLALLLFGRKLIHVTFFVSGFIVALVASAYCISAALTAWHPSTSVACGLLIGVPVLLGIVGGFTAHRWFKRAFLLVGFAAGGAAGYWAYIVALNRFPTGIQTMHNDLTFYLCLGGGALLGAVTMAMLREILLIVASCAIGAIGMVPALAVLALGRIDDRFLWIMDTSDKEHRHSPFVYGQVIAALGYFLVGVLVQRAQHRREKRSELNETLINSRAGHHGPSHIITK